MQRTYDSTRQRAERRGDELEDREQDRAVEHDAQHALTRLGDGRIDRGAHGGSEEGSGIRPVRARRGPPGREGRKEGACHDPGPSRGRTSPRRDEAGPADRPPPSRA